MAAFSRIADHCRNYQGAVLARSLGQLFLNLILYAGLIALSYAAYRVGYWPLGLALAIPAGGLLVRLFIIQHDCGHGAFFKNKRINHAVGWVVSILTFTPYGFWRDAHNRHHANSGNLARRGMGAVDLLTVEEYRRLSPYKKFLYQFYRHPLTLLVFGPPIYFMFMQRWPLSGPAPYTDVYVGMKGPHIWKSVMALNAGLILFYGAVAYFFGALTTLFVFMPVLSVAGIVGAWLFYVQHQYEDAYWEGKENWDHKEAALLGSSHYDLPKILQWFTGNIGLHHIHHLSSLIPNYRLQECYDASEDLKALPRMSLRESFRSPGMKLWDEARGQMVGFKDLKCAPSKIPSV